MRHKNEIPSPLYADQVSIQGARCPNRQDMLEETESGRLSQQSGITPQKATEAFNEVRSSHRPGFFWLVFPTCQIHLSVPVGRFQSGEAQILQPPACQPWQTVLNLLFHLSLGPVHLQTFFLENRLHTFC